MISCASSREQLLGVLKWIRMLELKHGRKSNTTYLVFTLCLRRNLSCSVQILHFATAGKF
jgi:hypothetical protein